MQKLNRLAEKPAEEVSMQGIGHRRGARQQSALELLTTYSWAFLIIAIFIAAIAVFTGSRPPSSYLPATCNIDPAFPCAQAEISSYNSIVPITFTVLFTNDLGAVISFPSNALNVTLTDVGQSGTNSYLGNCYPQIALQGAVIRCFADIPGTKEPSSGSQVGVNFYVKYSICKNSALSSCTGAYKTTGYSLQSFSSPGTGIYRVSFDTDPQSGRIVVNNIQYTNGDVAFLVGGKETLFASPPLGYSFSSWSINSISSSISSLTSQSTTLTLSSNATITAVFYSSVSSTSVSSTSVSSTSVSSTSVSSTSVSSTSVSSTSVSSTSVSSTSVSSTSVSSTSVSSTSVSSTSVSSTSVSSTSVSSTSLTTTYTYTTTIYYVPITLTNSQGSATPTPFQQMIVADSDSYSSYEQSGLQNVEFTTSPDGQGTVLQAWIEANASSTATHTIYWVNLPNGIGASSSVTIYMNFMPSSVMSSAGPTGEAPELSPSYGEYDNGPNVFPALYANFAGTACPSGWTCSGTSQNNGISIPYSSLLYTSSAFGDNPNQILDMYGEIPAGDSNSNAGVGFSTSSGYNGAFIGFDLNNNPNRVPTSGVVWLCTSTDMYTLQTFASPYENPGTYVWSVYYPSSSGASSYVNYVALSSSSGTMPSSALSVGGFNDQGSQSTIGPIYWMRIRSYPPSGAMPSVSFGSV